MLPLNKPKQQSSFSLIAIAENWLFPFIVVISLMTSGMANGCNKDNIDEPSIPGISASFTEEFRDAQTLTQTGGWVQINKTGPDVVTGSWNQGHDASADKFNVMYGFPAYSYTTTTDEFIYASTMWTTSRSNVSSWLLTPVLNVKNGDKISFYTRSDAASNCHDRLQVLMNSSSKTDVGNNYNSTGSFKTVLFDINNTQAVNGYPVAWTKYEHTFSGISGKMNTRIAFRFYVPTSAPAKGVGIDLFRFEVL